MTKRTFYHWLKIAPSGAATSALASAPTPATTGAGLSPQNIIKNPKKTQRLLKFDVGFNADDGNAAPLQICGVSELGIEYFTEYFGGADVGLETMPIRVWRSRVEACKWLVDTTSSGPNFSQNAKQLILASLVLEDAAAETPPSITLNIPAFNPPYPSPDNSEYYALKDYLPELLSPAEISSLYLNNVILPTNPADVAAEQQDVVNALVLASNDQSLIETIVLQGKGGYETIRPVVQPILNLYPAKPQDLLALGKVATHTLLSLVLNDLTYVVFRFKYAYLRKRPFQVISNLTPLILTPNHPSFPSGHACDAWLACQVLQSVFNKGTPVHQMLHGQFALAATNVARNRVRAGVHFESDSAAGKELATQMWNIVSRKPDLTPIMAAARAEW